MENRKGTLTPIAKNPLIVHPRRYNENIMRKSVARGATPPSSQEISKELRNIDVGALFPAEGRT